jgi:D-lactate dehydrogenase (cytochrome)
MSVIPDWFALQGCAPPLFMSDPHCEKLHTEGPGRFLSTAPIVGHAGDGNFHVGFMIYPNEPKEMAEAERLNDRLVHRALSLDGTCTGEHGIGCGKMDFLIAEHGEAVNVMRAIKQAIDPDNIMNPGKILRI